MKKLFLLVIVSTAVCIAHAQTAQRFVLKKFTLKTNNFSSGTIFLSGDTLPSPQNQNPIDNMPVISNQPVLLTYVGNNGNGLDIYKAQQDNMPVAKPDAGFYSAMPVATSKIIMQKLPYSIPKK